MDNQQIISACLSESGIRYGGGRAQVGLKYSDTYRWIYRYYHSQSTGLFRGLLSAERVSQIPISINATPDPKKI